MKSDPWYSLTPTENLWNSLTSPVWNTTRHTLEISRPVGIMQKLPYLCRSASRGSVSNGPRCLFPGAKLCLLKDLNEYWEDVGINHSLRGKQIFIIYENLMDFFTWSNLLFQEHIFGSETNRSLRSVCMKNLCIWISYADIMW